MLEQCSKPAAVTTQPYSLDFAYAYGRPQCSADMRAQPADFRVDEISGFEFAASEPAQQGEHVYLQIEKTLQNTPQLASRIAVLAGVKPMDVGYAGMKDRNAITRQWFSVYLPGRDEPDWHALDDANTRVLGVSRHTRKLRRGEHIGNRFVIRLSRLEGDRAVLEERLGCYAEQGVPNYFGPQRFGREGSNLVAADDLFVRRRRMPTRTLRGLALSAARSFLFNRLVSERVKADNWRQLQAGDVASRDGVSPTGPLWGRGRLVSEGMTYDLEESSTAEFSAWRNGLEHVGLQQERRSLCLYPQEFSWTFIADQGRGEELELCFVLGPGEFATSILRELAAVEDLRCRAAATDNYNREQV